MEDWQDRKGPCLFVDSTGQLWPRRAVTGFRDVWVHPGEGRSQSPQLSQEIRACTQGLSRLRRLPSGPLVSGVWDRLWAQCSSCPQKGRCLGVQPGLCPKPLSSLAFSTAQINCPWSQGFPIPGATCHRKPVCQPWSNPQHQGHQDRASGHSLQIRLVSQRNRLSLTGLQLQPHQSMAPCGL